ncbi:MAG TPA: hypothetical protein VGG39_02510 [Polyangiaceae bacterium]|jgi:hypothetical protein
MRTLVVSSLGAIVVALVGCQNGASDSLTVGPRAEPFSNGSLAAGVDDTFNHQAQSTGGDNGITDPVQKVQDDAVIGTPDVVARLHGAQKVQYASLGLILADLGVNLSSTTANSAGALYAAGQSPLGVAVYASRTSEMITPSTSALAKEYDIFAAAAPEILASNLAASKRCPGTELVDSTGAFTADGLSCLMGKPSKPEHLTLANQLVSAASDKATGQQIAIATLLAAAHTSE